MAKANTPAALTMTQADAEQRLSTRIQLGEVALGRRQEEPSPGWHDYNTQLLKQMFTTPDFADEYNQVGIYRGPVVGFSDGRTIPAPTPPEHILQARIRKLDSIRQQLELFQEPMPRQQQALHPTQGKDIFIVHGHDDGTKNAIARFIQDITGKRPRILHQEPNEGRTIIEKFEYYALAVGFAVILLTPDDVGSSQAAYKTGAEVALRPRARQNVILELGYYLGKLGRSKVCALSTSDLELPSDYDGVLFVEHDDKGAWKLKLAGELAATGYLINQENLFHS